MITDMFTALISLVFIVVLVAALERNHRRTFGPSRSPFSTDIPDRDFERVRDELRAAADYREAEAEAGAPTPAPRPSRRRSPLRLDHHVRPGAGAGRVAGP